MIGENQFAGLPQPNLEIFLDYNLIDTIAPNSFPGNQFIGIIYENFDLIIEFADLTASTIHLQSNQITTLHSDWLQSILDNENMIDLYGM